MKVLVTGGAGFLGRNVVSSLVEAGHEVVLLVRGGRRPGLPETAAVIDGGMATPGLLAWVATSKFADHLPLYRIEQIAARQEVRDLMRALALPVG